MIHADNFNLNIEIDLDYWMLFRISRSSHMIHADNFEITCGSRQSQKDVIMYSICFAQKRNQSRTNLDYWMLFRRSRPSHRIHADNSEDPEGTSVSCIILITTMLIITWAEEAICTNTKQWFVFFLSFFLQSKLNTLAHLSATAWFHHWGCLLRDIRWQQHQQIIFIGYR